MMGELLWVTPVTRSYSYSEESSLYAPDRKGVEILNLEMGLGAWKIVRAGQRNSYIPWQTPLICLGTSRPVYKWKTRFWPVLSCMGSGWLPETLIERTKWL